MNKILKFYDTILNLDNLECIRYDTVSCKLYFTLFFVTVDLTEEEFKYLTEFLKNDLKFHEINKKISSFQLM